MGFFGDLLAVDMMMVFFGSLFAQFLAEVVFLPMLWSPRRIYADMLGINKTPWEPPSFFTKNIIISVSMFFFIKYICLMAFQVYTLRKCSKKNYEVSLKATNTPAAVGIVIYMLLYFIPIIRVPIMMFKQFIPFIQNLVYGIPMSIMVTFMYYISKIRVLQETCGF